MINEIYGTKIVWKKIINLSIRLMSILTNYTYQSREKMSYRGLYATIISDRPDKHEAEVQKPFD